MANKELVMEKAEILVAAVLKEDDKPHKMFLHGHGSHVYNLNSLILRRRTMCRSGAFLPIPHTSACRQNTFQESETTVG